MGKHLQYQATYMAPRVIIQTEPSILCFGSSSFVSIIKIIIFYYLHCYSTLVFYTEIGL